MKIKNISYPYPVLGNEDDARGVFNVRSFKHVLSRQQILLSASFDLENKTIEKLIEEKKAAFTVEVECPGTFFRKSYLTHDRNAKIVLPSDLVREHVSVTFFIRATESIEKYHVEGCHEDYEGFTSEISAGDVLALGGATSFIADKDFDPLRPVISSLIAIKPGTHDKGPMVVGYNDDKIIIKLSKNDHKNYLTVKSKVSIVGILHAAIVLPVLADAIRLVNEKDQELQGMHWFRRLEVILRQQELGGDEPLSSAQQLLSSPVERCLFCLTHEDDEE